MTRSRWWDITFLYKLIKICRCFLINCGVAVSQKRWIIEHSLSDAWSNNISVVYIHTVYPSVSRYQRTIDLWSIRSECQNHRLADSLSITEDRIVEWCYVIHIYDMIYCPVYIDVKGQTSHVYCKGHIWIWQSDWGCTNLWILLLIPCRYHQLLKIQLK